MGLRKNKQHQWSSESDNSSNNSFFETNEPSTVLFQQDMIPGRNDLCSSNSDDKPINPEKWNSLQQQDLQQGNSIVVTPDMFSQHNNHKYYAPNKTLYEQQFDNMTSQADLSQKNSLQASPPHSFNYNQHRNSMPVITSTTVGHTFDQFSTAGDLFGAQQQQQQQQYEQSPSSIPNNFHNTTRRYTEGAIHTPTSSTRKQRRPSTAKSVTSSSVATTEDDNDDHNEDSAKRKHFLERNRQAALKCRQRKKQWLANLQHRVEFLTTDNEQLQTQAIMLREEVLNLKTLLLSHRDCKVAQANGTTMSMIQNAASVAANHNMAGRPFSPNMDHTNTSNFMMMQQDDQHPYQQ